jgi:type IV secretion system protein VirD4
MDFMMKTSEKESRTLVGLYHLMCEEKEEADKTFKLMKEACGHAAAAANQVLRVGSQERGSILSTAYRQIDWIGDSNIQKLLKGNNFNFRSFLKGNMDIYVILPNEQVKDKSRLVRMLLALIKAITTQALPSELPQDKILFLLDELAQFGYCEDVEQFIEVMRSYRTVIWSVFQSMSQIQKVYKKPDLFLGMPIKQFFTLDDLDTLRWIQALGGKTTIKTKSLSTSHSDSHQKLQVYRGNISNSESENVQETGIDLIKLNEIRELPFDDQIIFWAGNKPIRCKKLVYHQHPYFKGRFDENPFERKGDK